MKVILRNPRREIEVNGKRRVKELLEDVFDSKTLSADFVQVVQDKRGQVTDRATGTLKLSRPDRFRWDYAQPYVQTIVADGRKLWLYDPDLGQVTVRSLEQGLGATPAMLLSGSGKVGDAFAVAVHRECERMPARQQVLRHAVAHEARGADEADRSVHRPAPSAAADEGHLGGHHRHEQHVGFNGKAGHVQHRLADVRHVHQRLDLDRAVGLRHALGHALGHLGALLVTRDEALRAPALPIKPIIEAIFTMQPLCCFIMGRATARLNRNVPLRLISTTLSHSSAGMTCTGPPPATRRSRRSLMHALPRPSGGCACTRRRFAPRRRSSSSR